MNLHTTPELARQHRDHLLAAAAEARLARQARSGATDAPGHRPSLAGRLARRLHLGRRSPAPVAPVTPVTPAVDTTTDTATDTATTTDTTTVAA